MGHLKRIEEASLNAWPALQQILFDGWILRFSRGYTRRANSVNALYASSLDIEDKITTCEKWYTEKGLPTHFRLTPFSSPPDLDQVLERRGYQRTAPVRVLALNLAQAGVGSPPGIELSRESLEDWLALYCQLHRVPLEQHQTHRDILQTIPSPHLLASLADGGQAVTCGLGVLENEVVGLFDIVTDVQCRNRGYGTQLVAGLLAWARQNGARHAYLQVMSENTPACRLYDKFGFRLAYPYWYRTRASIPSTDQ